MTPFLLTLSCSDICCTFVTNRSVSTSQRGHTELCSAELRQAVVLNNAYITQFGDSCYVLEQHGVSWFHAETLCVQSGGHLVHIANQAEQDFIAGIVETEHSQAVWIGLHDRILEERFQWSSGNVVNYTNWLPGRKDNYNPHNYEDCVLMRIDGQWDDIQCGGDTLFTEATQRIIHGFICQFATINAASLDGDLSKCSTSLQIQVKKDNGALAQNTNSCYELISNKGTWSQAEYVCQQRGGHLASIQSEEEQKFVMDFINRHFAYNDIWIGLNDAVSEGIFQWSSGEAVRYLNWASNHTHLDSYDRDDCVVFRSSLQGVWDDVSCGSSSIFGTSGEVHSFLCKYGLNSQVGKK